MPKKKSSKPKREFIQIGNEPGVKEPTKPATTDDQVLKGESITIQECKKFIEDCKKGKREDYLVIADRSWDEIEKRNKNGKLYGGQDLYKIRRWTRFPLWWACWKIRQPIVFARLPEPVLKDSQGDDPIGRTACVIGERFIKSILKTFDCYSEFSSCRDDFLVTNWGWGRWFYKVDSCYEEERVRLQMVQPDPGPVQMDEMGQPIPQEPMPPVLIDPRTQQEVEPGTNILEDEKGPYLLTSEEVIVENEEVYFQSQLFSALYIEPDIRKYSEVTRLAYEYHYSFRDFKQRFGQEGLDKITLTEIDEHRTGKPIIVFEYWDKILKECRWFAETSDDFFQPTDIYQYSATRSDTQDLKEVEEKVKDYDNSDLYGLSGFFPSTEPLAFNQSTKTIWPTPEFFQVQDIIDDINSIVSRLVLLTKAFRVRFLYDSTVPELTSLISETGEGGGLGVPNLQAQLIQGKGTLQTLVQYLPIEEIVNGVINLYQAFSQRLDMFYQITGISDLIRGQTNPDSDKTYGERQMEGKYALNRIEPYQERMQDWAADNFLLGMEMGLKLFKPATIDEYITPETLDPEDKERYEAALELLKANKRRRFRVEFGTDATFATNQEWKKNEMVASANAMTKMLEAIANTAQSNPDIALAELKIAKHVIGELNQGKLFIDEITDALETAIEKASQPRPPEPNIDLEKLKLQAQGQSADAMFKQIQLKAQTELEYSKLAQKSQQDAISNQLKELDLMIKNGVTQAELEIKVSELRSSIAQGWQELSLKKEALLAQIQAEFGKKEMEQLRLVLDARVKAQEITLEEADQQLRAFETQMTAQDNRLSLQERVATEQRLQEEHHSDLQLKGLEAAAMMTEAMKPEAEKAAPVNIDLSRTLQIKEGNKTEPKKKEKKKK